MRLEHFWRLVCHDFLQNGTGHRQRRRRLATLHLAALPKVWRGAWAAPLTRRAAPPSSLPDSHRHVEALVWSPDDDFLLVQQASTPGVCLWQVATRSLRSVTIGASAVARAWLTSTSLALCCARAVYWLDANDSAAAAVSVLGPADVRGSRRSSSAAAWQGMSALPPASDGSGRMLVAGHGHMAVVAVHPSGRRRVRVCPWTARGSHLVVAGSHVGQLDPDAAAVACGQLDESQLLQEGVGASGGPGPGETTPSATLVTNTSLLRLPERQLGFLCLAPSYVHDKASGTWARALLAVTRKGHLLWLDAQHGRLVQQQASKPRGAAAVSDGGAAVDPTCSAVAAAVDEATGAVAIAWSTGVVSILWPWPGPGGVRWAEVGAAAPSTTGVLTDTAHGTEGRAALPPAWLPGTALGIGALRDPAAPPVTACLQRAVCGWCKAGGGDVPPSSAASTESDPARNKGWLTCCRRVGPVGGKMQTLHALSWAPGGMQALQMHCTAGAARTVSVCLPPPQGILGNAPWPFVWRGSSSVVLGRVASPLRRVAAGGSWNGRLAALLHSTDSVWQALDHLPPGSSCESTPSMAGWAAALRALIGLCMLYLVAHIVLQQAMPA